MWWWSKEPPQSITDSTDHRDYLRPDLVDPVCHGCNLRRGPARLSLTRVRDHLLNGALMSDEGEADTPGTTPLVDVAVMGGKARWRGIPKEERASAMREVVAVRWARPGMDRPDRARAGGARQG